jgi:hypothetical protein
VEKGRRKQMAWSEKIHFIFRFSLCRKPAYHLIEVVLIEQLGMYMKSSLRKWIGCKQSYKSEVLEAFF